MWPNCVLYFKNNEIKTYEDIEEGVGAGFFFNCSTNYPENEVLYRIFLNQSVSYLWLPHLNLHILVTIDKKVGSHLERYKLFSGAFEIMQIVCTINIFGTINTFIILIHIWLTTD